MRLATVISTVLLLGSWPYGTFAQPPAPRKEHVDAFFESFRHFLAMTSAGVDECGERFPERKDGFQAAYQRARSENLDVFVQAESTSDFAENVLLEKSRASRETVKAMAEYCGELPRFVDVLAAHAAKLQPLLSR